MTITSGATVSARLLLLRQGRHGEGEGRNRMNNGDGIRGGEEEERRRSRPSATKVSTARPSWIVDYYQVKIWSCTFNLRFGVDDVDPSRKEKRRSLRPFIEPGVKRCINDN